VRRDLGTGMQAALGLVEQSPPTRPRVLARPHLPGARPAADRTIALAEQRVDRDVMAFDVRRDVGIGPPGERSHLHLAAAHLEVDLPNVGPGRGLAAAYAGSPGVVVGERPLQRLHLAQGTAGVGVALEESRTVLAVLLTDRLARLDREHPDRHALGDLVTYPKRLREVQPGVEEHHV